MNGGHSLLDAPEQKGDEDAIDPHVTTMVAAAAMVLAVAAVPALELQATLHGSATYPNTRGHVD